MSGKIGEESVEFPAFSLLIREFDAESGSNLTASSATQDILLPYSPEIAAKWRVGGLIRSARGSGERDQSCKPPIFADSSPFRRDSVPRADFFRLRPDASTFARSKVLGG